MTFEEWFALGVKEEWIGQAAISMNVDIGTPNNLGVRAARRVNAREALSIRLGEFFYQNDQLDWTEEVISPNITKFTGRINIVKRRPE